MFLDLSNGNCLLFTKVNHLKPPIGSICLPSFFLRIEVCKSKFCSPQKGPFCKEMFHLPTMNFEGICFGFHGDKTKKGGAEFAEKQQGGMVLKRGEQVKKDIPFLPYQL